MSYVDFFKLLGRYRDRLSRQELQTLRGQAMAGEYEAARRGLQKILMRKEAECGRNVYAAQAEPTV